MGAKSGFTLVEVLIIMVILGVLAAIVIPQFSQVSIKARELSLCGGLQTMRSHIDYLIGFESGVLFRYFSHIWYLYVQRFGISAFVFYIFHRWD